MLDMIKLLLPAKRIPIGSTVTKKTGQVELTLCDSVTIYCSDGSQPRQTIKANAGAVFLRDERGNYNAISDETELVWTMDMEDLRDWADNELEEADCK